MNGTMQVWTLFFGAATLFLILVQVAILGGMLWAFLRLRAAGKDLTRVLGAEGIQPSQAILESFHAIKAAEAAAIKAAQTADSVNELVNETRARIDRIENTFNGLKQSVIGTGVNIQRNLSAPVQEYRAVSAAVRSALSVLRRP